MALTTPNEIWTPDSGDDYALTTDLAAMADDAQEVFELRANYFIGTTAARTAYAADALEGALWYDTDLSAEYRMVSSSWVANAATVPGSSYNYRPADSTELDALTGMSAGDLALQVDTGVTYRYDGSNWIPTPLYCSLSKSSAQSLTTSAAGITWDVETSDLGGMHDNVTNTSRITAPVDGVYEFTASVYNSNSSGVGTIFGQKNAETDGIPGSQDRREGDGGGLPLLSSFSVELDAGDYVQIMALHTTTAGNVAGAATRFSSAITAKYLGPA